MSKVQEKYQIISYLCFLLNSRCTVRCWRSRLRSNHRKGRWIRRMDGSYNHRNFNPHSYMDDVCLIKRNKWEFS